MNTRKHNENLIKNFSEVLGILDIHPHIHTHLGRITMLDGSAHLIENIAGDWVIKGTMDQLTDSEFDMLFTAVQDNAIKILASAASK
jgi:hypothetical protein